MSELYVSLILPQGNTAANTVINTSKFTYPTSLSIVGVLSSTEIVTIQIPTSIMPDINVASNWQDLYQDGERVTITSTNHGVAIPVGLLIKVNKPITANNVGIRWS